MIKFASPPLYRPFLKSSYLLTKFPNGNSKPIAGYFPILLELCFKGTQIMEALRMKQSLEQLRKQKLEDERKPGRTQETET